jgi:hypothetical protein
LVSFLGFFAIVVFLWLHLKSYAGCGGDSTEKCDGINSEGTFNHRDNLNTALSVDDQQEGQVVDAGFN